MAAPGKSKPLGLSIVIGFAIGTLAAVLSSHFAAWLIAGMFLGIAPGAAVGRKKCPECEAREERGMSPGPKAQSREPNPYDLRPNT